MNVKDTLELAGYKLQKVKRTAFALEHQHGYSAAGESFVDLCETVELLHRVVKALSVDSQHLEALP
jgi:hypothetical protein